MKPSTERDASPLRIRWSSASRKPPGCIRSCQEGTTSNSRFARSLSVEGAEELHESLGLSTSTWAAPSVSTERLLRLQLLVRGSGCRCRMRVWRTPMLGPILRVFPFCRLSLHIFPAFQSGLCICNCSLHLQFPPPRPWKVAEPAVARQTLKRLHLVTKCCQQLFCTSAAA